MEIPQKTQNQIMQFQQIQQQLQVISAQRHQLELQNQELTRTLEELTNVKEGSTIYKSIGSLLIKAEDKESVEKDLKDQKEVLEVRLKTITKQEGQLKEKYTALQKEITKALGEGEAA